MHSHSSTNGREGAQEESSYESATPIPRSSVANENSTETLVAEAVEGHIGSPVENAGEDPVAFCGGGSGETPVGAPVGAQINVSPLTARQLSAESLARHEALDRERASRFTEQLAASPELTTVNEGFAYMAFPEYESTQQDIEWNPEARAPDSLDRNRAQFEDPEAQALLPQGATAHPSGGRSRQGPAKRTVTRVKKGIRRTVMNVARAGVDTCRGFKECVRSYCGCRGFKEGVDACCRCIGLQASPKERGRSRTRGVQRGGCIT